VPPGAPVSVLAEGTAPVAIAYQVPPASGSRRTTWAMVAFAAASVIAIAAVTATALSRRSTERAFSSRFPIATTDDESRQLVDATDRWTKGERRLLSALAHFSAPTLDSLKGSGACTLSTAGSLRYLVRAGEEHGIARTAQPDITALIADGRRTRFASDDVKQRTLTALSSAVVVVRVTQQREPELDRARDTVTPGVLTGTAYAFDPATGRLACAGTIHASSPTAPSLSQFPGLDAAQSAARDAFATEIDRALSSSLRAVD
jgi:hypothetical protein